MGMYNCESGNGFWFLCVAAVTENPLNSQPSTALLYPKFAGQQLRGLGERHLGETREQKEAA